MTTYYCKKHGAQSNNGIVYATGKDRFCYGCVADFWREHIGVLTETPPPAPFAPCPFCGGVNIAGSNDAYIRMRCISCGTYGPYCKTDADAIAKWNKRAP